MEIHAPEKPILTIKEAAVHLLIVTAGILIALSLEAVVEYVHHRTIVREAREIMRREIEENRTELDKELAYIKDKQMKEMMQGIERMRALAAHEASDTRMMIEYRGAKLHSAGQSTAQLMGAFAYMDYQEVSRWSEMYDLQAEFLRTQSAGLVEGTAAFSFVLKRDLLKTPTGQLEAEADNLRRAVGTLVLTMQEGTGLRARYNKILEGH
jgi:hypothetical protein